MTVLPRLLITLGDVAGIGPEVVVRAWRDPELHDVCRPVIVGDPDQLRRTLHWLGQRGEVTELTELTYVAATPNHLLCLRGSDQDLDAVKLGRVSAAAGRAAYDFLCRAIDLTLAGKADGIVTLPLHKEGLLAASIPYPGHTEILAERTGCTKYAMALLLTGNVARETGNSILFPIPRSPFPVAHALAVTHVTLHLALRDVFTQLRTEAVLEKIELTDTMLRRLLGRRPRLGVCGLNPHASDGGLFGDEERTIIAPAVEQARALGVDASGPWPCDTLFVRAVAGQFDGLVAMYHDQGHIAIKLLAGYRAVNVSLGLPIVRTSVAHGTAYDIAGKGVADCAGLIEAARVAARLAGKSDDNALSDPTRRDEGES